MADLYQDYRKHMENKMQDEDFNALETRIIGAAREKRTEESLRAKTRTRRVMWGAVACMCAVAVAGGSLLVTHMAQKNEGALVGGGNTLCLSVFAGGSKRNVTPAIAAKNAENVRGFNFDGAENITDFGRHRVIKDFTFDFSCQGNNIKTLKYEINGKAVFVVSGKLTDRSDRAGNPYEYMPKEQAFSSFIAKPGDDLSSYRIHVMASVTSVEEAKLKEEKDGTLYSREEAKKLKERANAGGDMSAMLAPSHTIADVRINDALNGTIISVTATFTDGTTRTVRYQLSAVKDYLNVLREYYKAQEKIEKTYETQNGTDQKKQEERDKKRQELDRSTKFYCITELK